MGILSNYNDVSNGLTDAFRIATMKVLRDLGKPTDTTLSLEALRLCGLHLAAAIRYDGPEIDFTNLTTLMIESCFNMRSAFEQLAARGAINFTTPSKMRLKSFYLRHESSGIRVDGDIEQLLFTFLCSFQGLEEPHVLLEGPGPRKWALAPILIKHSQTLRTLVWDQRTGPRMKAEKSTTVHSPRLFYLDCISRYCQKLVALGISTDWDFVYQPKNHVQVPYPEPQTIHNTC